MGVPGTDCVGRPPLGRPPLQEAGLGLGLGLGLALVIRAGALRLL